VREGAEDSVRTPEVKESVSARFGGAGTPACRLRDSSRPLSRRGL